MKKISSIFVAINNDSEVIGYCKDKAEALSHLNDHEQDDGKIFEVTRVFSVYYPEEPELEVNELPLKHVLENG